MLLQDWSRWSGSCCCESGTALWSRRTPSDAAALPSQRGRCRCSPRPLHTPGSAACGFCRIHPSTLPVSDSCLVAAATRRRSLRHLFAVASRQTRPQLRRAFYDIRGQDGSESERWVCGKGLVGVHEGRHQPSGAEAGGFGVRLRKQLPKSQEAGHQIPG